MALITMLSDETSLPALNRIQADMIVHAHRAVQATIANEFVRRTVKPLLTKWQLKRATPAAH